MVCCYYRFFRRQKVLTKYRREITFSLLYLICIALQISVDFSLNLLKYRLESGLQKPENLIFPKKCDGTSLYKSEEFQLNFLMSFGNLIKNETTSKVSVFGVFLVRIFPYSD